jgi:hypothetical protein
MGGDASRPNLKLLVQLDSVTADAPDGTDLAFASCLCMRVSRMCAGPGGGGRRRHRPLRGTGSGGRGVGDRARLFQRTGVAPGTAPLAQASDASGAPTPAPMSLIAR